MQIPYGVFIILSILTCVFLNDRFENKRCVSLSLYIVTRLVRFLIEK